MVIPDLVRIFRDGWRWCFKRLIAPALRYTAKRFQHWAAAEPQPVKMTDSWKQAALDDFSSWLADMPELKIDAEPGPQSCDLYTLLAEFATLRQEIKFQTRQQHVTVRAQEKTADRFDQIAEQLHARIARLDRIQEAQRRAIEETVVDPFLDIRDALVRGQSAAGALARANGFWRRAPKGTEALAEGYAMALRRFDRALERLEIRPIATLDHPFDPTCMRAVEKRQAADKEPGIVLEQVAGGFLRGGAVLRTAEVVVNGN